MSRQLDLRRQRHDRIERRARHPGPDPSLSVECARPSRRPSAPHESLAGTFVAHLPRPLAGQHHHVREPRVGLPAGARAAVEQEGAQVLDVLALHEELAERRMPLVLGRIADDHLGVARHLEPPPGRCLVPERHQPHLDVIGRRDRDLLAERDVVGALTPLDHVGVEYHLAVSRGQGPRELAVEVAKEQPKSGAVERAVGSPPRECHGAPVAAAAAVRDEDAVATVRQHVGLRNACVGTGRPHLEGCPLGRRRAREREHEVRPLPGRRDGRALDEERLRGPDDGVRVEATHHRLAVQHVVDRGQDHSLVVRHERADDRVRRPGVETGCREVHGLVQAVAPHESELVQTVEIGHDRRQRERQREQGRIGRDDHVVLESALEPEIGDAEGTVLVVALRVEAVVSRLRYAPRNSTPGAIRDLGPDGGRARPAHQAVPRLAQEERRHQVLEHRAAPGQERGGAVHAGERPAELEPVLLRDVALRDGDEAGQAGLGGEEVVVVRIAAVRGDIVADVEQPSSLVVQEGEVHRLEERPGVPGERVQGREDAARGAACPGDRLLEALGRGARLGQAGHVVGHGAELLREPQQAGAGGLAGRGQLAQRGIDGQASLEGGPCLR
jgi:hypothetical protein